MKEISIPVMIDDSKNIDEFMMTRVAYFYVEAIEAPPDITIDKHSLDIPMLTLEFSGLIHKPIKTGDYFESPDQIEELYTTVEKHESLYVDSDNIWIPNKLFDKPPRRGDIYRVPFDLFIKLYSLCRDDASLDASITQSGDEDAYIDRPIQYSEGETAAFSQWTNGIVEKAKAAYPKSERLKLEWRE